MNIITRPASVEEIIKKSRFIGIINTCTSEKNAKQQLLQIYDRHPQANHIVFAYRILGDQGSTICRFNDAGEPSGTAGKPVFQHLEGKQLINTLAIVVRYFGGVKLGAGGLTRAYGNAIRQAIEHAHIETYVPMFETTIKLDYEQLHFFEYQLEKLHGKILQQNFSDIVELKIQIPQDNVAALKSILT